MVNALTNNKAYQYLTGAQNTKNFVMVWTANGLVDEKKSKLSHNLVN